MTNKCASCRTAAVFALGVASRRHRGQCHRRPDRHHDRLRHLLDHLHHLRRPGLLLLYLHRRRRALAVAARRAAVGAELPLGLHCGGERAAEKAQQL